MALEPDDVIALTLLVLSTAILLPFSDALVIGVITAYGIRFLVRIMADIIGRRPAEGVVLASFGGLVVGGTVFLASNAPTLVSRAVFLTTDLNARLTTLLELFGLPQLTPYVAMFTAYLGQAARNALSGFLGSLPGILLEIVVYVLVVAAVYHHADRISAVFYDILDRMPAEEGEGIAEVIRSIRQILSNIFIAYGSFSVLWGLMAMVAYYVIGVVTLGRPIPLFWAWGIWVALAAFLQGLGSIILTGPLMIYYFMTGAFWTGFWIAVYEVTINFLLPQFVLPYLGARRLNESVFIMLLGFIAGPLVFGIKGIILGPVILIILKNLVSSALLE